MVLFVKRGGFMDVIKDILSMGKQASVQTFLYAVPFIVIFILSGMKHYYKLKIVKYYELKVIFIVSIYIILLFINFKILVLFDYLFNKYFHGVNNDVIKLINFLIPLIMMLINTFITICFSKIYKLLHVKKKLDKKEKYWIMPFFSVVLYWLFTYMTVALGMDINNFADGWLYKMLVIMQVVFIFIPIFMITFGQNTYKYIIYFNNNKFPIRLRPIQSELIDEGSLYRILYYNSAGSLIKEDTIRRENIHKISKFY